MPAEYVKLDHVNFLPHPFQFILLYSFYQETSTLSNVKYFIPPATAHNLFNH